MSWNWQCHKQNPSQINKMANRRKDSERKCKGLKQRKIQNNKNVQLPRSVKDEQKVKKQWGQKTIFKLSSDRRLIAKSSLKIKSVNRVTPCEGIISLRCVSQPLYVNELDMFDSPAKDKPGQTEHAWNREGKIQWLSQQGQTSSIDINTR